MLLKGRTAKTVHIYPNKINEKRSLGSVYDDKINVYHFNLFVTIKM